MNREVIVIDDEEEVQVEDRKPYPQTHAWRPVVDTAAALTRPGNSAPRAGGGAGATVASQVVRRSQISAVATAFAQQYKKPLPQSPPPARTLTETEWTERILTRSKVGPFVDFTFPKTISIQFIQLHKIGMRELQSIVPNGTPSKQQFVVAEQMVSRLALAFLQVPKHIRRCRFANQPAGQASTAAATTTTSTTSPAVISPISLSSEQNVLSFLFRTVAHQLLFLVRHTGQQDEEDFCLCGGGGGGNGSGDVLDLHQLVERVEAEYYFKHKNFPEEALWEFEAQVKRIWSVPPQHLLVRANRYLAMVDDVMDEVFAMLDYAPAYQSQSLQQQGESGLLSCARGELRTARVLAAPAPSSRLKRLQQVGLDLNQNETKRLKSSLKHLQTNVDALNARINNVVLQLKTKVADPLANLQV